MRGSDGWGRTLGRDVHNRLVEFIDARPDQMVFKLSMEGVERLDVSFASEAIVELVRRYRGSKGICLVDLADPYIVENIDAAAERAKVPVVIWNEGLVRVVGMEPSPGNREALSFALARSEIRATEFADASAGISIANASTKFKQLWEQGFLMRQESAADTGGVEFVYKRVGQ